MSIISFVKEYLDMIYDRAYHSYSAVREICFDHEEDIFMEEGFIIENIYTEILPSYIELFRYKLEDMLIKDRYGNLTLLWVG